jgi:hypothetical protein
MSLPKLPKKMEGSLFFRELLSQFLAEYNTFKLAMLGLIVEKKGVQKEYESLRSSLRKVQWVKLVGLKAIHIEDEIVKQIAASTFVLDPLRQTAHSLCITDCLIHTKSALDSMAVFLTDKLGLVDRNGASWSGGKRDFKWLEFRQSIYKKDMFLKHKIKKLEPWLNELREIRDEWIHVNAIESFSVHGKSDVGMLPIPRKITLTASEQFKLPVNSKNFWSTKEFVNHHYSNLAELFKEITDRCIQIENLDLSEPVIVPQHFMNQLSLFPTHATEDMTIKKMRVYFPKSLTDW